MTAPGTRRVTARAMIPGAAERFGQLVHSVPAAAWSAPTPCADWSVRDLVNHLTAEHLWVPPLLAGATLAEVGDRFDGDVLGDDPLTAWDAAIAASLRSWATAREDQPVNLSSGPTPAGEYAEQMLLDLVVHAWDLARGAGLDVEFDAAQPEHALDYVTPKIDGWRVAGIFADPVPTNRSDAVGRLIALTGRDPGPQH